MSFVKVNVFIMKDNDNDVYFIIEKKMKKVWLNKF